MTVADVAKEAPGGPYHHKTVRKWINIGVSGVKLQAERVGGRICISRESVNRFIARCTSKSKEAESIASACTRKRQHNPEVMRTLRAFGVVK